MDESGEKRYKLTDQQFRMWQTARQSAQQMKAQAQAINEKLTFANYHYSIVMSLLAAGFGEISPNDMADIDEATQELIIIPKPPTTP